jgi:Cohesin domain
MQRWSTWFTALLVALILALIGAPVWDFWHYRSLRSSSLRSSPGSLLPLGVMVPATAEVAMSRTSRSAAGPGARFDAESATRPIVATAPSSSSRPIDPRTPAADDVARAGGRSDLDRAGPRSDRRQSDQTTEAAWWSPLVEASTATAESSAEPRPQMVAALPFYVAAEARQPGQARRPTLPIEPAVAEEPRTAPPPPPDPRDPDPKLPPEVRIVPLDQDLLPGESVDVKVEVWGVRSLSSLPFHVRFDPAVLAFVDAQVASALAAPYHPVLLASVHPNRPGDLAVGLSLLESSGLFSGSGALITLKFRAIVPGESTLQFDRASVRGRTGKPVNAEFRESWIRVR